MTEFISNVKALRGGRKRADTEAAVKRTIEETGGFPGPVGKLEDLEDKVDRLTDLVAVLYRIIDDTDGLDSEALAAITPCGWKVNE